MKSLRYRVAGVLGVLLLAACSAVVAVVPAVAAAPTISVVGGTCPLAGGGLVTISGSGFGTNLNTTATIGGQPATVDVLTSNFLQVTCIPEPLAADYALTIVVAGSGQASSTITYGAVNAPTITSVSPVSAPASGLPVTPVTITGTNLSGATSVSFGQVTIPGKDLSVTPTQISLILEGAHAPNVVPITVSTPNGTASAPHNFRFIGTAAPTITSLNPVKGATGTEVTITGSGFAALTGVNFGAQAARVVSVDSDTSMTVTVPANLDAGAVDVVVSTSNGTVTDSGGFTVTIPDVPIVTGLTPNIGTPGTTVLIAGSGFTGATGVTFGGIAASSYAINSDTSITAMAPIGMAQGAVDVVVTNAAGPSATSSATTFTNTLGPIATITLSGQFTLIGWLGADGIAPADALDGGPGVPPEGVNNVTSDVSAIWTYDSVAKSWRGYFPGAPPAFNDLTSMKFGGGYFVALKDPAAGPVTWYIERAQGPSSSTTQ